MRFKLSRVELYCLGLALALLSGCSSTYTYHPAQFPSAGYSESVSPVEGGASALTDTIAEIGVGDWVKVQNATGDEYEGFVRSISDTLVISTDRIEPDKSQIYFAKSEVVELRVGEAGPSGGEKATALTVAVGLAAFAAFVAMVSGAGGS